MKLLLSMLFALLFMACNAQDAKPDVNALANSGIDPYFIESQDTISTHGPNHITRDLLQDKNGDYWFATWLGIIKYDGKVFTNYTLKEGLIHFHVVSAYKDAKDNLWFGTARGGLYRYDGKSFTLFTKKDGLIDNTVTSFAEDHEGHLWFGTEKGITRYDGTSFTNFSQEDGLRGNNVSAIIADKKGLLWIACSPSAYMREDGGICRYDGKSFTDFNNEHGQPFKNVVSLLEDRAGNIWIGQFDGLTVYNGKTYTDMLSDLLTYYMMQDKGGNIWLTHSEPNPFFENIPNQILYRYSPTPGGILNPNSFMKIIEMYEPNDFQLFGKMEDSDGNIWFGTMHGPCRYDGVTFTYFRN